MVSLVLECCPGSPPPTRGARRADLHRRCALGITPAYAGSTHHGDGHSDHLEDHPRLRGEHLDAQPGEITAEGSPPPTRGAPDPSAWQSRQSGITPAYAGSTTTRRCRLDSRRDHPRLRGEHMNGGQGGGDGWGSPPPTRGALDASGDDRVAVRITPAYAGSTRHDRSPSFAIRDHPRLRGEHTCPPFGVDSGRGSPPPTRGARLLSGWRLGVTGITPAYAGSTDRPQEPSQPFRDHPRLRGEHPAGALPRWFDGGSPPPTRGARHLRHHRRVPGGITPAYAGSTPAPTPSPRAPRDHPRLRGEHKISGDMLPQDRGSPPPTRGAPIADNTGDTPMGITPAYAGSTLPRSPPPA